MKYSSDKLLCMSIKQLLLPVKSHKNKERYVNFCILMMSRKDYQNL